MGEYECTNSVNDFSNVYGFDVSPNPVSSNVEIESKYRFDKCEVYTLYGQLVDSYKFNSTFTTILCLDQNLVNGLYVLKISSSETTKIGVKKIIYEK